jgi:hypothetical protein
VGLENIARGANWQLTRFLKTQGVGLVLGIALLTLLLSSMVCAQTRAGHENKATANRPDLCYAFLRDGDLWTVCQGKREHIALGGRVFHYAVSTDGSFLAIVKEISWSVQKGVVKSESILISLKAPFKTTTTEAESSNLPDLRATCGTILIYNGDWSAVDILSGKPLGFPPNKVFHCSSDRRVIVGWASILTVEFSRGFFPGANLSVNVNGEETKPLPIYFMTQGHGFDVSPNGEHLAYFRVAGIESPESVQLCTMKIAGQPTCVEENHAEGSDGVSLSNLGGVLYTGETEGECFYKDEQHSARKRLPGYSEGGPCNGIYFWHPGMQSPVLMEDLSRHPQWIAPEVAARLHEWAATLSPTSAPRQQ